LPQDGYNVYKWLTTGGGAEPLSIDSARVGIGGDSAGGQLTACIVQRLGRERFVPMPRYRMLTTLGAAQMVASARDTRM
jgi:acetyl esterase/lipase